MKKILLLTALFVYVATAFGQWTTETINWGNKTRTYLKYAPPHYDGSQELSVVFFFHGLNSSTGFAQWSGFRKSAENKNAIVIVPQALNAKILWKNLGACWNAGVGQYGIQLNGNVPDVGLVLGLLDKQIKEYNVDQSKVFATGFSMGGYMTNRMGIESKGRIKKIASVSGTKGDFISFSPTAAVSVLHIHGTSDNSVKYKNNDNGIDAEDLVARWVKHNKCDATPEKRVYPNKGDNLTWERFDYKGGTDGAQVSFIKVTGGQHKWYHGAENDVNTNDAIWEFFQSGSPDVKLTDAISTNLLPTAVSKETTFNLNVKYSATGNRDVVVELWSATKKLQDVKTTVKKGRNTALLTLKLTSSLPVGDGYSWKTSIRPVNGNAASALEARQVNFSVKNVAAVPYGKSIWMSSNANRNFVSAEKYEANSPVEASKTKRLDWEVFRVVDAGNGYVALVANANDQYVCADEKIDTNRPPLVANRSKLGGWEKFKWIAVEGNQFALQSKSSGRFVSIDPNKVGSPLMVGNNTQITVDETFTWGIVPTTKKSADGELNSAKIEATIHPNPAQDFVTIDTYLTEGQNVTLHIINAMGAQIKGMRFTNLPAGRFQESIDLRDLKSGLYFVRIKVGTDTKTIKLLH